MSISNLPAFKSLESYEDKSEDGGQLRGKQQQGSQRGRKKSTKGKGGEVEEMASFGIFLHLAVLCFFIVRYADSYGYNRGYNPYNRGYNPYNRGYYNRGYNPYNKAGADDKGHDYGYNPYNRGYNPYNRGYNPPPPPPSYGYKKH